ncbi:hypothetical protein OBBRIDRAFT_501502 [Obba rivulosa]|uniref:Uncharacterized protein n=1 Tax=Obba rivulosa TaxID=1052685 RepID=A0A8E2DUE8_9APHY|nr:hypothetical protein OBBRIDRAFT_501502 [Obba rivulosa]
MSLFEITDFIPRLTKLLHDAVQANARLSLEKRELEKEQDHRLLAAAGIGGEAFADDHKLATIVADAQSETAFLKAELLKAQEELHLKGVESERLVAEYNKCVEERMALSTEVASFRTQITSEQIDSIEESNSLRQTILQHEQTLLAKTQEVEVLQTEIKTLQTQNELVRIETQAKLDEAEGEKTALSSKLEELRNTAARGQNHIGAMLIEANLEIERLKKALAAARHRILCLFSQNPSFQSRDAKRWILPPTHHLFPRHAEKSSKAFQR